IIVASAAGALGTLLALWGVDALVAVSPQKLPRAQEISVNSQVLALALVVSVLAGLVVGLAPALQAKKLDPSAGLKGEALLQTSACDRLPIGAGGFALSRPGIPSGFLSVAFGTGRDPARRAVRRNGGKPAYQRPEYDVSRNHPGTPGALR